MRKQLGKDVGKMSTKQTDHSRNNISNNGFWEMLILEFLKITDISYLKCNIHVEEMQKKGKKKNL